MTDSPLTLAQPEDAHTRADWEAATAAVLRKSRRLGETDPDDAVWDKLTRTTLDGIGITPLGLPGGEAAPVRPAREGAWDIRALVAHPAGSEKTANEEALVDLEGGVTSLWVAADADTDLAATLASVLLDLAPVVLEAPTATAAVAEAFLALPGAKHPDSNLGADPLGAALREISAPALDLVALARTARQQDVRAIVVDATAAHDLGASDAQELGWSIAAGVSYLRELVDAGFSVAEAAGLIEFRYAATDEQFPTIAKLRAARVLWARVLELSGLDDAPAQRQHATTSRPMLSKYDPYVNMLRGTVAAFAAGVGGADAVTVLPFDSANGRPEGFGRRIARNVSHLLIDESHVAVVADPAGGSYAVEQLTGDLAEAGWAEFGRLEEEWADGSRDLAPFLARIADVVARRDADIAKRKRPLTGVSEFPNLAETLPERAADPLNDRVRRYGAAFEALRDAPAERPVFLATLGTIAQHTARATFISNLFAAGGIAVEQAGPTSAVDDVVAAYTAAGAPPVVCLAGTDAAYEERGAEVASALREAGATRVIVAGKASDYVDDSAAMGVDALAFLNRTREALA
ncbi:methylmalonyl-CoA mutase family protein [Nocardioides sp.]|uniref:methylmalonyl-CoA mutase family protein n=1 Tax=Nocardioides sp. TaxID=35761 RepID=UPI00351387D7